MAKAKKLPSGQWRTLVYDYTDENKKRHYESFTAETKKESEYLAAEFALNKNKIKKLKNCDLTFKEASCKYLELKKNVLSPSTVRGYIQMQTYYSNIDGVELTSITNEFVQKWINEFSANHAPKTVKNACGFLKTVITEFVPEAVFKVTLPQNKSVKLRVPMDDEIKMLVKYLKENDTDMLIAVYLSAFGTLRRSEVCGLTSEDIQGSVIHVHNTIVINPERVYVLKEKTKTESSDRYIELPEFVINELPKSGPLVRINPDVITKRLRKYLLKLEINPFRFHDLRHYSASIMHAIGIPDQYIMQRGGWSSDRILKDIYRGTIDDFQKKYSEQTNSYFDNMQHEMQHK